MKLNKYIFISFFLSCLFVANNALAEPQPVQTPEKGRSLLSSGPWVTTAVYKQVNRKADKSKNYINDAVAKGTVSSARYSENQFVFVPLNTKTGEFDLSDISALVKNSGKYELLVDGSGHLVRRVYDTRFGYTHTRVIEQLSDKEFTYIFEKDGESYFVEHLPYRTVYPEVSYPARLQAAIDKLFSGM